MSTEQNKAIVRRFVTEILTGNNLGLADELMAPGYVNRATGADLAGFKQMLGGLRSVLTDIEYDMDDLVAEGDAVVARWKMEATNNGSGKRLSARGLTYYRLANGKIVEDDPISTPDLIQVLASQMTAQSDR
jgi:predicted ester cyclase